MGGRSMAIKFSCGSCGKKFTAKDEHAGRQSKCPACGWGIVVPFPSVESAGVPRVSTTTPLAPAQASTTDEHDEPDSEPRKPKSSEAPRQNRTVPVVGIVAGALGLAGIGGGVAALMV